MKCALCGMLSMVATNVGVLEGIAGGLEVSRDGGGAVLVLPGGDETMDGVDEMRRCCGTELKKPTKSSLVA